MTGDGSVSALKGDELSEVKRPQGWKGKKKSAASHQHEPSSKQRRMQWFQGSGFPAMDPARWLDQLR